MPNMLNRDIASTFQASYALIYRTRAYQRRFCERYSIAYRARLYSGRVAPDILPGTQGHLQAPN